MSSSDGGLVVRYNADGSLDTSFGVGGFVYESAHSSHETIFNAVAIQSDGKIVAAGYFVESGGCARDQSWVVRYNADGTRDTTFGGGDGEVEYPYLYPNGCPADSYHYGLALLNSGKIVVAGASKNASANLDFAAARLNANGTLDTSFNLGWFGDDLYRNPSRRGKCRQNPTRVRKDTSRWLQLQQRYGQRFRPRKARY